MELQYKRRAEKAAGDFPSLKSKIFQPAPSQIYIAALLSNYRAPRSTLGASLLLTESVHHLQLTAAPGSLLTDVDKTDV